MRGDLADHQVHSIGQAIAIAARLDQAAVSGEFLEQLRQGGALLPGYLEALLQLPGCGRVLHLVPHQPEKLFVVQHPENLTVTDGTSQIFQPWNSCTSLQNV